MLVYGWNSFKLFKAPIHQYPFGQNFAPDVEVEIRQKYFHLFWIPFFSIGKVWGLKQNGQLYEMSPQVKGWLEQCGVKPKTPWYAFTGLMLVGALLAGFLVFTAVKIRNRNAALQEILTNSPELSEYFNEDVSVPVEEYSLKDEFRHARPGDFLMFTDTRLAIITVMVYSADDDHYILLIPDPAASGKPVADAGLVEFFDDSAAAYKKVKISKEAILAAVPHASSDMEFKGSVINAFSHLTTLPVKAWRVEHQEVKVNSER